ncbi:MAG TPA: NAD-dependent epimerase/dehydratase family protein [Polyangiaceae bacterium LLY-WYZ-15_(1-7)]|nr:NAD(P)-dependent oxidoreductase [Myxococcales bacterium]MAT27826.1 NAD(P)-dependent oxidoreductase [Sandaracinus sp.]HJL05836.1 NAD-dependent epimerase/dehydratase family protein [Polyangiaceae bacterium LLY-WYZ-15_(1-7)]MBJ71262.1 NAD(P)-dependent oxidoreductase [Sandaracinus sp.]HJL13884.1 NAD-dependent epimerase/dehydratase family protein [Polyangiaceae bacterium LLY-WYZ-15_(1-7)]
MTVRTVLVAGCGFVGTALAVRLRDAGHRVLGVRRRAELLPPGVEPVAADLTDRDGLARALGERVDAVDDLVYAASADGRSEEAYVRAYVTGLDVALSLLAGRRLRRALFTASTAVYGVDNGSWVDEASPTEPTRFTGARLLDAEARLHDAPVETASLRLAGIYGPGRTRLVRMVRDGQLERDRWTNRIHRDDCAGALHALLETAPLAPTYVGVDDAPAPLAEVAAFLAGRLGVPAPELEGPPTGKRCANARLRGAGWTPIHPTYREGYPEIVDELLAGRTQG